MNLDCLNKKLKNGYQIELPDQWMQTGFNWEVKAKHHVPVKFFGKIVYNETTGKYEHVDAEKCTQFLMIYLLSVMILQILILSFVGC